MKNRYLFIIIVATLFISKSFSQVTLEDKIGQMVMVGFSGTNVSDSLKKDLQNRNLGGVALFAANVLNPTQLKILTTQLKSFSTNPLLIGIDQEGGRVARLGANNGYAPSNSAYKLGTILNREDSTRHTAAVMAGWLIAGGINLNYAPVVDVNVNPSNPVIGMKDRSFSSDPDAVANHARWFSDEFRKRGVLTVLKHFPGHGSSQTDSHLGFTDVTNSWSDLELIPYRSLINSGNVDLIMAGHIFNKNIDTSFPASISEKTIKGLLRDSLKFQGVVITDELFMKAISDNYTLDYALELCVKSGTDILLFSTNLYNKRSLADYVIQTISAKVRSGIISENLINSAYERIMNLKKGLVTNIKYIQTASNTEHIDISNYPNPFNSSSVIKFNLPKPGNVSLKIFDAMGREIAMLVNSFLQSGVYTYHFDAGKGQLSSGVYYYRLAAEYDIQVRKMLLVK